ncbi:MAG TPA: hypothetical protein VJ850_01675 [Candidatus Limnocylindrales bacterium]|nr:hypothetical protein [Candidatus Limnocylindrales bacterium]
MSIHRLTAGLALVAMLGACQSIETPSASPVDLAAATPTAFPDQSAAPLQLDWAAVELPQVAHNTRLNGVLATVDGFVVFGNMDRQPIVWTSADAAAWAVVPLPKWDATPVRGAANAEAAVLLGGGSTDRCAHPDGEFLWRRVNGHADWVAVPFNQRLFCAGGGSDIASGVDAFAVAGTGAGEQPFAWWSPDGMSWQDAGIGLTFDAPPWLLAPAIDGFLEVGRGSVTDVRLLGGGGWGPVAAPAVAPAFNGENPGMEPAVLLATKAGTLAVFQSDDAARTSAWLRDGSGTWREVSLTGIRPGSLPSGAVIDGLPFLVGFDGVRAHLYVTPVYEGWFEFEVPQVSAILGLAQFDGRLLMLANTAPADADDVTPAVFVAEYPPK